MDLGIGPVKRMTGRHNYCDCGRAKRKESQVCMICHWDRVMNPDITDRMRDISRRRKRRYREGRYEYI